MIRRHLPPAVPVAPTPRGHAATAFDPETSVMPPRRRGRRLAAAAIGLAAVTALSACQWTSTVQTDQDYEPADGTSTHVGQVHFNNLLVVSPQQGGRGSIVGMVTNHSGAPAQVSVSLQQQGAPAAEPAELVVAAGGTAQLTEPRGRATTIESVPAPPGAMVMLDVQAPAGRTLAYVPVLSPQGYYATLAPSAPAPAPGGTATATPPTTPAPTTPAPTTAP